MFYIYNKNNGKVKMVSQEPIDVESNRFDIVEIDDNDYEGKTMFYKNEQLIKNDIPQENKKIEEKDALIATINKATTIKDLKDILTNIINKE